MEKIPDDTSMETPSHTPLGGLDPADLLRQGLAEDTLTDDVSPPFTPPTLEELAALFPQFEILDLIGKGGMGAVYKVRQMELDRIVALKILPPAIGQSPAFSNRFTREAKALAKLNHPGIVTIHEFGQRDGLHYLLMEFVDGLNLAQLMKTGRISPREALAIVPQICDALQFAHDQGIVHRDIKPENILLDRLGRVKVADFGIAKVVAAGGEDPIRNGDTLVPVDATIAGKIIGTPQYMAPEQLDHPSEVDHRADIYALGVVFYQMLTGELPGKRIEAPSKKVSIDVRLDEMVLRALESNPEKRYQTAHEFRTVLDEMPPSAPLPPLASGPKRGMMRRWWWVFLIIIPLGLMVCLAAGSVWAYVAPKKYEAEATIQVVAPNGNSMSPQFFGTQFEVIKSRALLGSVAQELDLPNKWAVGEPEVIRTLQGIVNPQNIRGTDLISIRVRHTSKQDALGIANAVVMNYQRSFGGKAIVHEIMEPRFPVSPNIRLTIAVAGLGGLLLSPLMALVLIPLLHKWFPEKKTEPPAAKSGSAGKWIAIGCGALAMACLLPVVVGMLFWYRNAVYKRAMAAERSAAAGADLNRIQVPQLKPGQYKPGAFLHPAQVFTLERGSPYGGVDLDTGTFVYYNPTVDADYPEGAARWREERGIDLVLDSDSASAGVLITGTQDKDVDSGWWDAAPEAALVESVLPPFQKRSYFDKTMTFLAPGGPSAGTRTYVYRTLAGSVGILRLGPTHSSTGVRVAWRLIKDRPLAVKVTGTMALPKDFSEERQVKIAKAALTLLASSTVTEPSTDSQMAEASNGSACIRLKFPDPGVSGDPDEMLVTFPLTSGSIWTRRGDLYWRHAMFTPAAALALAQALDEKTKAAFVEAVQASESVVIEMKAEGDLLFMGMQVSEEDLKTRLRSLKQQNPGLTVIVKPDTRLSATAIQKMMETLSELGVDNISFAKVEKSEGVEDEAVKAQAETGQASTPLEMEIAIKPEGLFLMGERVSEAGLKTKLESLKQQDPDLIVSLEVDERVKYARVAEMLDLFSKLGITRVSFASDPDTMESENIPSSEIDPPKLQLLAWQDEVQHDPNWQGWRPSGEFAKREERKLPEGFPQANVMDARESAENPRFLSIWISHPSFDAQSVTELKLMDDTGKPLETPTASYGIGVSPPTPQNQNLGWITANLCAGRAGKIPAMAKLRLDYSAGPWRYWTDYPVDSGGTKTLSNGVEVTAHGQGADGRAFVQITRDRTRDPVNEQFDFVAVTKDGTQLERISRSETHLGKVTTELLDFDAPLEQVKTFRCRKRPIHTISWLVPLQQSPGGNR